MNELAVSPVSPISKPKELEQKTVEAVYIWRTGRTFFLSKKETIVADTFLKTRSYAECARALKREGFDKNWLTCRRWLEKGHIKEYIAEKMEESGVMAGWTEGRWMLKMHRHVQGIERLQNGDLYAMKLIAQVKGFGVEGGGINNAIQINFTERGT